MDDIIKQANDQLSQSEDGSNLNRQAWYDDVKFTRLSDQWPDEIKQQRKQEGRPALTVNKLPAFVNSVVNEGRQAKPAIKISPVDSGADEDTAEVIGGLIKSIENKSNASVAYDTALDHAVTGGFGFWRVDIDYAHDESFDLEAKICRIANPLSVHWDTTSDKFDASDWDFCFVSELYSKEEYKKKYPEGSLVSFDSDSRDENGELWIVEDQIRIAEYFTRDLKTRKLHMVRVLNPQTQQYDIQVIREDEMPILAKKFFERGGIDVSDMKEKDLVESFIAASGVELVRERDAEYFEVKRRIINGVEVLQEDDWPGSMIPVVPVWGTETYLDGRRHFRSLVRDMKDSQLMFNFWRSASTELVALAPKAPFIGPKGFVPKGQEGKWSTANTRSHAYLEFEGQLAPQRQGFAGVPSGVIQEAINASSDMQEISGIYPAAIGARSNETSGRAIMARERQGDVANFHFIDNLNRAIEYTGRILVEIIPSVYSPRETIRILGEDDKAKVIQLTQQDGGSIKEGIDGQPKLYNLEVGKYDVTVSSGPSFATQREETRETLIEIMRNVPQSAPFVGDVLLDHMDFVGADKIAKRLKSLLPPEVRQAEDSEQFADDPEKAALVQQNQAQQQEFQQAQQAVMQEIEKIKAENEALKKDKQADMMRVQMEAQYKGQEIALKDRELKLKEIDSMKTEKPEPTYQEQWEYDRMINAEKQAFEAVEKEKDRQLEIEKVRLSMIQSIMDKNDGMSREEAEQKIAQYSFQYDNMGNIVGATKVEAEMPENGMMND